MIPELRWYWSKETRPRLRTILKGPELWLAVFIGILFGLDLFGVLSSDLVVGDVTSLVLNYAAIALGFCLAGLTLAITLPSKEFQQRMATTYVGRESAGEMGGGSATPMATDTYSDLLFVFSWTALLHMAVIIACIASTIVVGPKKLVLSRDVGSATEFGFAIACFLLAYAVFQFIINIVTLAQFGHAYVAHLKRELAAASAKSSQERASRPGEKLTP